jgi:hypothetical protein
MELKFSCWFTYTGLHDVLSQNTEHTLQFIVKPFHCVMVCPTFRLQDMCLYLYFVFHSYVNVITECSYLIKYHYHICEADIYTIITSIENSVLRVIILYRSFLTSPALSCAVLHIVQQFHKVNMQ